MKALVTGPEGFIGSALCRALLDQGFEVRAFLRPASNLRLLADLPVEHVSGDLTHAETLPPAMQGIDVVFHTAALQGNSEDDPGRFYAITVEGTRAVMQAALDAGVTRVVHTSSVSALGVPHSLPGPWANPSLIDEYQTWNYRADYWPYGYAKYLAELEVQRAVAAGLDVVIVNPTSVMGPGDIYRQTSSVVVQVARKRVSVTVDGGLNVIHVADVVAGQLAALEHGRCGARYILGGQNLTTTGLIQRIAEIVGAPVPAVVLPAGLARSLARPLRLVQKVLPLPVSASQLHLAGYFFYYDTTRAREELGFEPRYDVNQAIRDAYEWFKASGAVG